MSPGSTKPGRDARAAFAERPSPVSTMPPHQTAIPLALARSWMRTRLEVAADPARLDVDHLRGAEGDRVGGRGRGHHRLVQADRGLQRVARMAC